MSNASSTVSASFSNAQMYKRISYENYKPQYASDFVWTLAGTGTTLINNVFTVPGHFTNYCFCNVGAPLYNRRISFDANTRQLFDFAFFSNSLGQGQVLRVETRNAPGFFLSSSAWAATSFVAALSDIYTHISANTWHNISISINSAGSVSLTIDGSVLLQNSFIVTNYGTYIGFLGDGASDYSTIKNFMIELLR